MRPNLTLLNDAERVKQAGDPSMSKCMECSKPPTHEAIWAEGMGWVWFCDKHWAEWSKEHKDDIDKHREVEDGQVGPKYGEKANKRASADDGKKTGDCTGVGFFIPLPKELAEQFPFLGDEDKSDPHATFLYVGNVPQEQEEAFLKASREAFAEIREPVRAHLQGPEYFIHPDKGRRVAVMGARYSHDLAGIRWKLRDKLIDAGIQVDDSFPLIYRPHVTLAYLEGLTSVFDGTVPKGDWEFDSIEVWGFPKLHTIPFGSATAKRVASMHLAEMSDQASRALMKFLADVTKRLGVAKDTYVVGGAVRNFVIQQPIKDIDVVIDSVAAGRDSEWLAKKLQGFIPVPTNLTTNQYGVAILTIKGDWELGGANLNGEVIEIANARKESYGGEAGKGYKPHLVEPSTIQEDAIRREFTFNSLMWRLLDLAQGPDKAEIIDLTGCGLRDLQEGVARCPQDPDKTFSDDPSRMCRAIKFLLKYGLKIAPDVEASIKKNKEKLRNVPPAHLSNMIINVFYEGGIGKKALLEMKRLGLLDVVKDIARTDKSFAAALGNWAEKKADLALLFDLMDLGMPTGKRLNFLDARQRQRVREITVQMGTDESDAFIAVLASPGKIIDMPGLGVEFGLKGKEFQKVTEAARVALLADPILAANPRRLEGKVRQVLSKGGRTAATFNLNIGDSVFFGKYKNKKGKIKGFRVDEKGDVVVTIEPYPKGRQQDKELKLFKIRPAPEPWLDDPGKTANVNYTELKLDDEQGKEIGSWIIPESSVSLLIDDSPLIEKVASRFSAHDEEPFPPRLKMANAALAQKYHEKLLELRQELQEANRVGITSDTPNLWLAWYWFYRAGQEWGQYVIDTLAIPPKMAKAVELAVRAFATRYARGKSPRNGIMTWFKKNEKHLEVLDQARSWPERTEESGIFKQGPFTIHNTIQASGKALENAEGIIGKALQAVKKSGVPGFAQMAYGSIYLVGQLGRKNWAAWYIPSKDAIYLRPAARGSSQDESARHLIHELGHRLWKKKLDSETKTNWVLHHAKMDGSSPDVPKPEPGDVLPLLVNNKTVKVDSFDPKISKFLLVDVKTGNPVGHVDYLRLKNWIRDAVKRHTFPTLYATTNPEEHFCEALSLFATGKLKGDNLDAFADIILKGGTGASAQRVAAKYKNKKKVKTQDGDDTVVYEYSERQVQNRNREKAERVEKLRGKLSDLQKKVKKDLKSDDLKTRLTALAVGLINDTYERVGNDESAKDGHFGVTGWQAKHVTIGDGKATIKYIGKSGVSQEKETRDPDIIRVLKEAVKGKSGTDPVFEVDDVKVDSTVVNDYLKPMDITAKDIRGLHANRLMQQNLKAERKGTLPDDKKKREEKLKAEFDQALEATAEAVGHEPATLKSQYLVPGLEDTYMSSGQVMKNLAKQASLKQAIINIDNATDGDTLELRGFFGLISSLTLYEQAIVQDMNIHSVPLIYEDGEYTLRGHVVDPYAVKELIYSGYLQEDGDLVRLSDMFEVKKRLYKSATKTHAEKEDEAVAELIKPMPKKKPPRKDLKNERVDLGDKDTEGGTADTDGDLSLNYKRVAARWLFRQAGKVPSDTKEKKPGDYWQTDKGGWGVKLPDGKYTGADDEEHAAALAAGKVQPGEEEEEGEGGEKELTPEEKAKAKAEEEKAKKEQEKAERAEADAKIKSISNVSKAFGDDTFSKALKGMDPQEQQEVIDAYEEEMDSLKAGGVFKGDSLSEDIMEAAVNALTSDISNYGQSLAQMGKAMANRAMAMKVVTNPMIVGGTKVSSEPKDAAALKERSNQAFDQYSKMPPELRGAAMKQMSVLLKHENDEHKLLELQHIANGLALAAVINDEKVSPLRKEPAEGMKTLVKALHKNGGATKLLGMSTDDFYTPEGRDIVASAMDQMSEDDLYEVLGGTKGPYGKIISGLQGNQYSENQADVLKGMIKDLHLDGMTSIHTFLVNTALKNGKDSSEAPKKAMEAIQGSEQTEKSMAEAIQDCMAETEGGTEDLEKCREKVRAARLKNLGVAVEVAKKQIGEPDSTDPATRVVLDAESEKDVSNLEKKYQKEGRGRQSLTSAPKISQSFFYTWGLISEGQCAQVVFPRMETRRRNQTMAKRLSKKGAQAVTADLDRLANLFENDYEILGVEERIAKDMAFRCDMLSDHLEKVALTGDDVVKEQGFDPDDIGREKSGPLESEPDESYMKGEFDQQEFRELREKQQDGEIGPDVVTTEPQKPRPGIQAAFGDLAMALGSGGIPKEAAAQIEKALHLATTVIRQAKKELPPEFLENIEKKKEEAKDKKDDEKDDEKEGGKKKAAFHGYNLTA